MNTKRILIATIIGLLAGLFCAYGTIWMADKGELGFPLTAGVLAVIIYNRTLLGFVVGIADGIKLHPVLRGALLGMGVGMAMSIMSIADGDVMGGLGLMPFSIAYGIVADVVATKYGK